MDNNVTQVSLPWQVTRSITHTKSTWLTRSRRSAGRGMPQGQSHTQGQHGQQGHAGQPAGHGLGLRQVAVEQCNYTTTRSTSPPLPLQTQQNTSVVADASVKTTWVFLEAAALSTCGLKHYGGSLYHTEGRDFRDETRKRQETSTKEQNFLPSGSRLSRGTRFLFPESPKPRSEMKRHISRRCTQTVITILH